MTKKRIKKLKEQYKNEKSVFFVYIILRLIVIASIIFSALNRNFESVFVCALTLILFTVPFFIEENLGIEIPSALQIIIILFVFAAEILGELGEFYVKFPYWDAMLHTLNGFLCAAVGFSLVDILNRNSRIKFSLSPFFLSVVAFCFSMTIGVLWEFFEFSCDILLNIDMQKDTVINVINSVKLNPSGANKVVSITDIGKTVIDGKELNINGYLDIGLFDTMKDLLVNFVGAVIFSFIGYFYVKNRGEGKFAKKFIPTIRSETDAKDCINSHQTE